MSKTYNPKKEKGRQPMGFWCAKGPRTEEISLKNAELKGEKKLAV